MRFLCLILACLPACALASLDLTPRVGVYAAIDETDQVRVPFTLGFAIQPSGRRNLSFFVAPQIDIEVGDRASYAPTVRMGLLVREREDEWTSNFLSWLRIYGIAGMRIPGDGRGGVRAGIGVDSAVGLLLTAVGLKHGVPIPNAIEVIWEGVDGEEQSVGLHLGIAL